MRHFATTGLDLNGSTEHSPLCGAAYCGRTDIVRFLLNHGVDIVSKPSGIDPISWAVRGRSDETIDTILSLLKSNLSPADFRQRLTRARALDHAVETENTELVMRLVNEEGIPPQTHAFGMAAYVGSACVVRLFLDMGADGNAFERSRSCAIGVAAMCGHAEVVGVLLDAGADSTSRDSALTSAAAEGHERVVELLIEHGERGSYSFGVALQEAVYGDHGGIVRRLLASGLIMRMQLDGIFLELARWVHHACPSFVKLFLEHGADPAYCVARAGYNALHTAVQWRNLGFIIALLDDEAGYYGHSTVQGEGTESRKHHRQNYIDAPDYWGRTPLYTAARYGYVDIVRVLLAKGSMAADTPAASGHTPLSYVEAYRHRSYNDCRDELLTFIWEYLRDPEWAILELENGDRVEINTELGRSINWCGTCCAVLSCFEDFLRCDHNVEQWAFWCGDCVARGEIRSCDNPLYMHTSGEKLASEFVVGYDMFDWKSDGGEVYKLDDP